MEYFPIILTFLVFIIIMAIYFLYITRPQKNNQKNRGKVNLSIVGPKWREVQAMLRSGGPANYRQSIMEADKLVDLVLKSKVSGGTMGERLKNSRHLFQKDTYDKLWIAHKIRNKVAHEADFEGLGSDAVLAVRNFEKALKELRVI